MAVQNSQMYTTHTPKTRLSPDWDSDSRPADLLAPGHRGRWNNCRNLFKTYTHSILPLIPFSWGTALNLYPTISPLWASGGGGDQRTLSSPGESVCSNCILRGGDEGATTNILIL